MKLFPVRFLATLAPFLLACVAVCQSADSAVAPSRQQAPPIDPTIRHIGGGVTPPSLLEAPAPRFSREARKAKVGGVVLIYLQVDVNGLPQKVRVIRGVGKGFDEEAVEAVQRYRFKPAMENGHPVPVEMNIQVNFQMLDKNNMPVPSATSAADRSGTTAPETIFAVEPTLSPEARKAHLAGVVLIHCIVDAKGVPQDLTVTKGYGNELDEDALAAVRKYRYRPATRDGQPVAVEMNLQVNLDWKR